MSGYSNGIQITYKFAAFAGVSAAGQSAEKIAGPAGKTGRLLSIASVANAATTGAASVFTLRNNVTTADIYGSVAVAIAAIELAVGVLTIDDVSDTPAHVGRIPDGAVLELDGDGAATLGSLNVYVTIEWS